jgi:threonyl-tRNA synthetase
MAILGEREMEENAVAIRQQGKGNIGMFAIEEWTNSMKKFAAISED